VSSRTARTTQGNPVLKNQKKKKKKKLMKPWNLYYFILFFHILMVAQAHRFAFSVPACNLKTYGSWRDGSAVKSTDCSFRGPEFKSQQPHGGS
jgi:hypothetical protein